MAIAAHADYVGQQVPAAHAGDVKVAVLEASAFDGHDNDDQVLVLAVEGWETLALCELLQRQEAVGQVFFTCPSPALWRRSRLERTCLRPGKTEIFWVELQPGYTSHAWSRMLQQIVLGEAETTMH